MREVAALPPRDRLDRIEQMNKLSEFLARSAQQAREAAGGCKTDRSDTDSLANPPQ